MPPVVLFDIDLTMIRTNGAGSAAMNRVMHELIGVPEAFAGMVFAGGTDRAFLRQALINADYPCDDFDLFCRSFEERYIGYLEEELTARGGEVLPGVREAVAAAASLPHLRLGLATGNFRRAAEVKLRRYDLWAPFRDGGFAEDGEARADLVAAAIRRVGGGGDHAPVFVLGDSDSDIHAAKANGAVAIGVCTGIFDADGLRAAGADHVLPNLADTEAFLRLIDG